MDKYIFIPVLLPVLCGALMLARPFAERRTRNSFVFIATALTSLLTACVLLWSGGETLTLLTLDEALRLSLRVDGMGRVFALIVSALWPIAVLYSFEYMSHERDENRFFAYYTMTYGVVLGIALAENFFTLYLFYELLTLVTLPLVMHEMDDRARFAGRRYILYSMGGASLSFIAMVLILTNGSLSYEMGGGAMLTGRAAELVFLLGFFGFGVKAAVVPLHAWLPTAGVAPTPVTALLHAVAVVNSGVFAILRLIYYTIGAEELLGTAAQSVAMGFACLSIVFGSVMALRNRNLKRRLAYSTVSNLSYILLGATLMCPEGLAAALLHMVMHSVIKIILFFCAGALLCATHHRRRSVEEYEGLGKRLKLIFAVFALASLALIGVPPMAGFTSKWAIASAAAALPGYMGMAGVAALCVSAFLTGLYLVEVLIHAFWPTEGAEVAPDTEIARPKWQINTSLVLLSLILIAVSAYANELYAALRAVAGAR